MNNDPRLPTKEQIQKAEKLLSEREKWLKEVFIPQLQKKFPEFQKSYIQSNVVAISEENLEDYEEGKEIYNTPLTEFEITLGKIITLPDSKINAAIKEIRKKRIWPNDFEEQCRKHCFAVEIKWTDELLEKIKEINARTTELLTELYEQSKILRDILNEEYEKGNKLFADFEITGQIVYTNHNLRLCPENENPDLAHLLCEMTNHHIPSHGTLLYWNGRGDKDLEEVLYLGKDIKNWNIEIFRTVPEEIPINYYMHSIFMDGDTYNLGDILNMKPEDFQAQITIRTWDYMPERRMFKMNLKKYEELRKKAESGDAQAMLEYSEYLQKYHGLQEAHEWHTRAAKAGNPRAMAEEGNFILYGWIPGSLCDAFEYYKKSAVAGIRKSYANMADCYLYGWGTEQDFQKAREYYKKASWWKHRKIIKMIDSEDFRKGIDGCKKLDLIRDFYN